jgi:hypothetical protein
VPRYFFHLHEQEVDAQDEEGTSLLDDQDAMAVARDGARDLAADAVKEGRVIGAQHIEVLVEDGRRVGIVTLREVVLLGPPSSKPSFGSLFHALPSSARRRRGR